MANSCTTAGLNSRIGKAYTATADANLMTTVVLQEMLDDADAIVEIDTESTAQSAKRDLLVYECGKCRWIDRFLAQKSLTNSMAHWGNYFSLVARYKNTKTVQSGTFSFSGANTED